MITGACVVRERSRIKCVYARDTVHTKIHKFIRATCTIHTSLCVSVYFFVCRSHVFVVVFFLLQLVALFLIVRQHSVGAVLSTRWRAQLARTQTPDCVTRPVAGADTRYSSASRGFGTVGARACDDKNEIYRAQSIPQRAAGRKTRIASPDKLARGGGVL